VKEAALFVVTYDISDDRERYRIDKVLKGYGFRVQKSVFECRLGKADKSRLIAGLNKLPIESGSVKLYRVYAAAEIINVGKRTENRDGDFAYVL
jgi:CRISPR-associated protein Cas2